MGLGDTGQCCPLLSSAHSASFPSVQDWPGGERASSSSSSLSRSCPGGRQRAWPCGEETSGPGGPLPSCLPWTVLTVQDTSPGAPGSGDRDSPAPLPQCIPPVTCRQGTRSGCAPGRTALWPPPCPAAARAEVGVGSAPSRGKPCPKSLPQALLPGPTGGGRGPDVPFLNVTRRQDAWEPCT